MIREEKQYETLAIVPIHVIVPFIGVASKIRIHGIKHHGGAVKLNIAEPRLRPFVSSLVCYKCGLVATHFAVQRSVKDCKFKRWHLNLWAKVKDGNRLMTCDHLVPRSAGGTDDWDNLGTLCNKCNSRKGSKPLNKFLKGGSK